MRSERSGRSSSARSSGSESRCSVVGLACCCDAMDASRRDDRACSWLLVKAHECITKKPALGQGEFFTPIIQEAYQQCNSAMVPAAIKNPLIAHKCKEKC